MSPTTPATAPTSPEAPIQHRIYRRCLSCYFDSRNDQNPDCPRCPVPFYSVQCTVCGDTLKNKDCPLLKLIQGTMIKAESVEQIEVKKKPAPAAPNEEDNMKEDVIQGCDQFGYGSYLESETRTRDQNEEGILYGPPPREECAQMSAEEQNGGLQDVFNTKIDYKDIEEDREDRHEIEERSFKEIIWRMDVIQEEDQEFDEDDGTVTPRAEPPVLRKHSNCRDLRLDYRSAGSKDDKVDYFKLSNVGRTETDQVNLLGTTTQAPQTQTSEGDLPDAQPVYTSHSTSTQTQEYLEETTKEVADILNLPTNCTSAQKLIDVLKLSQDNSRAAKLAKLLLRLSIDTSVSRNHNASIDALVNGDSDTDSLGPTEFCPYCRYAACPVCPSQARDLVVDMTISKTFASEFRYCTHCNHGLCPRDHVEVIMKCSTCKHKACVNCGNKRTRRVEISTEPGVGVGNWEMGIVGVDKEEETYCVCCRCKRTKEEEKEDKSRKKESNLKKKTGKVRYDEGPKEETKMMRNIEGRVN